MLAASCPVSASLETRSTSSFHLHFVGDVLKHDHDAQIVARLAAELGRAQVDIRFVALRACGSRAGCA